MNMIAALIHFLLRPCGGKGGWTPVIGSLDSAKCWVVAALARSESGYAPAPHQGRYLKCSAGQTYSPFAFITPKIQCMQ